MSTLSEKGAIQTLDEGESALPTLFGRFSVAKGNLAPFGELVLLAPLRSV